MRVVFDASAAAQRQAGLSRYAAEMAHALHTNHPQTDLTLFYNDPGHAKLPDSLQSLPQIVKKARNKPWRMRVMFSSFARRPMDQIVGKPEIYHGPSHLLPYLKQAKTVLTVHDLIFKRYPQYHLWTNRTYLQLTMGRYMRAAHRIITPSECSKRDAIKFYNIPEEKFRVIYEAASAEFQPSQDKDWLESIREQYQLPQRFILHLGTIEPRKNLSRLLDAFQKIVQQDPHLHLVLVGKKGWLYQDFFQRLSELGLREKVIFPGFIQDEHLPALYQLATVFVFPSLYEGFGLPPLEALACGAPVVCSNVSSLPEVVGDAALTFQPEDTKALYQALYSLLQDEKLRQELSAKGLQQAAKFSWKKASDELMAVYQELYEGLSSS